MREEGGELCQLEPLLDTASIKRRDKLISTMQFHCFSDLEITMEIVFLSSCLLVLLGWESGVSGKRCGRGLAGLSPLPVKNGVGRGRRSEKGEGKPHRGGQVPLGVRWCRPVSSPPPSAEGEGPVSAMAAAWQGAGAGLRHPGAPRLTGLAASGAAPISEEKKRLKCRPACSSKPQGGAGSSFIPRQ